jgi:hypothetical protein
MFSDGDARSASFVHKIRSAQSLCLKYGHFGRTAFNQNAAVILD